MLLDLQLSVSKDERYLSGDDLGLLIRQAYKRAKMFNKINTVDKTMEELEEEFTIKPRSFRDYF